MDSARFYRTGRDRARNAKADLYLPRAVVASSAGGSRVALTLEGARLVDLTGERPDARLVIVGDRVIAAGRDAEPRGAVTDAQGLIVVPGFVDVHTHGGGGFNLHTDSAEEIAAYARWAPSTGTTAFLIGVVGAPGRVPEAELRAAVRAIESGVTGAEPLGIHLEGPYISVARRGAHDPRWLRLPDPWETEHILEIAGRHLRLVTLAPELPGADAMICRLVAAGVTVSIGHTDATYEQARAAIRLGITHATHCFNAMPPLHHRAPGPLGAIVESPDVLGELIADGVHVHPAAMRFLIGALGRGRVVGITDALSAAGLPEGEFTFAGQPARVAGGVARLADGTIAGSVLTMDQALRNLVERCAVSLADAVGMLTTNPARAAHVAARKGALQAGYDADVAVLDDSLTLQATYCRGELAFATESWRQRAGAARA